MKFPLMIQNLISITYSPVNTDQVKRSNALSKSSLLHLHLSYCCRRINYSNHYSSQIGKESSEPNTAGKPIKIVPTKKGEMTKEVALKETNSSKRSSVQKNRSKVTDGIQNKTDNPNCYW